MVKLKVCRRVRHVDMRVLMIDKTQRHAGAYQWWVS